jgi:spore coat protein CotH
MSRLLSLLLDLPSLLMPRPQPEYGPNEHPGAFLYEEGTIHDLAFTLTEEAMDDLSRNGPDVPAILTYAGVSWDVGFNLKGSSTYQDLGGKPSIKVDFEQWEKGRNLLGVRRLTLNSMIFDPTMLREHTAYHLYAAVGVPAPRHGYARVTINGEPYGLYTLVETLDEQWLRRRFPGDSWGNLYDSTFTSADLTSAGVGAFVLEEGDPASAYGDLQALVSALDRGDILDVLDRYFDREAVLGMWAVDLVTAHWDGYCRNSNNYLLYHATVADRWYFIPWGQDTAFRGGGSLYAGVTGRMAAACIADGTCRAALETRVVDVLDAWPALAPLATATWASIQEDCEADPRRREACDPDSLLDRLEDRPEQVRRELGL